ncbi:unnamed protein product [Penicillium pancosmium]
MKNLFTLGFGALSLNAILATFDYEGGSSKSILTTALITNLPQLLLSGLYFMYSMVLTSITATHEQSMFAHKTNDSPSHTPGGRATGDVLARTSLAIFFTLFDLRIYQPNTEIVMKPSAHFPGVSDTGMTTACGYSPLAISCALGVAVFLFIVLIDLSSRKVKPGMPVVGSCSLAISAACHPPKSDESPSIKPLLWGAVEHESNGKPGHCCLTSFEVEKPMGGAFYAGYDN